MSETFLADDHPPSFDEFLCERDIVLEYEYADNMTIEVYVSVKNSDGTTESIDHLLFEDDYDFFHAMCVKHELALIEDRKMSKAMSDYDDMKLSQQLKGL